VKILDSEEGVGDVEDDPVNKIVLVFLMGTQSLKFPFLTKLYFFWSCNHSEILSRGDILFSRQIFNNELSLPVPVPDNIFS
jgi:hypothetical protein